MTRTCLPQRLRSIRTGSICGTVDPRARLLRGCFILEWPPAAMAFHFTNTMITPYFDLATADIQF